MPTPWARELWEQLYNVQSNEKGWAILEEAECRLRGGYLAEHQMAYGALVHAGKVIGEQAQRIMELKHDAAHGEGGSSGEVADGARDDRDASGGARRADPSPPPFCDCFHPHHWTGAKVCPECGGSLGKEADGGT